MKFVVLVERWLTQLISRSIEPSQSCRGTQVRGLARQRRVNRHNVQLEYCHQYSKSVPASSTTFDTTCDTVTSINYCCTIHNLSSPTWYGHHAEHEVIDYCTESMILGWDLMNISWWIPESKEKNIQCNDCKIQFITRKLIHWQNSIHNTTTSRQMKQEDASDHAVSP